VSQILPPPIADYIQACNARDADALTGCFTVDAVVTDEGQTYRGTEEIRRWAVETQAAYHFTLEAMGVAEQGSETVVTFRLSGDFPGSPIELRFIFTLDAGKIAALAIGD
jgi:ketosteroid isomerase-like protein